jgi:hypothetical protein
MIARASALREDLTASALPNIARMPYRYLELPSTGIERQYMARIHAAHFPITTRALEELGACE